MCNLESPVPGMWVGALQRVSVIVLLTGTCTRGASLLNPQAALLLLLFFSRFNTSDTTLILSTFTPDVHVSKNRGLPNPSEPPASSSLKRKNTGCPGGSARRGAGRQARVQSPGLMWCKRGPIPTDTLPRDINKDNLKLPSKTFYLQVLTWVSFFFQSQRNERNALVPEAEGTFSSASSAQPHLPRLPTLSYIAQKLNL